MGSFLLRVAALSLAGALMVPAALASTIAVGTIDYDVTGASTAEFDILNQTGPNSSTFPDTTFPVTNPISLSGLTLTVTFASGPSEVFGSSYFTLDPDGLSFDGTSESTTTGQPSGFKGATGFTLSGTFNTTTFSLNNGTTVTVNPTFTTTFTDASGLKDGDFGVIDATTKSGPPSPVPEPESLALVGTGLAGLAVLRRRFAGAAASRQLSRSVVGSGVALVVLAATAMSASATVPAPTPVKLNSWTSPSSGTAGSTFANVTGTGFPSGSITPGSVTVTLAATCGGTAVATTPASSVVSTVGTSDRVQFEVPSSISNKATYFVSIVGTSGGGTAFASSNCSQIAVTPSPVVLASCVPTSSIAVTVGKNVNAYVPFGYWENNSTTGIEQVALEGTDSPMHFGTPGAVNSCASNSSTKEVVCTENNFNIDLITGTTLSTITSSSNQYAGFSGGSCENCGVAINAQNNSAIIGMGLSGSGGDGVQTVNLAGNTLNTAFPMADRVSENISVDPFRQLILSPGEDGSYTLLKIGSGNTFTEYSNYIGGTLDSAAEDCTTGIALSADEFTDSIYITDLTQAKFTAGTPGTWTAPGQFINLTDGGYSAGTSGISSAPGGNHLAVVTGEFGGSAYSALLLPSTSGTGTPALADYAYVGSMPPTPDGNYFSAGYDPHTLTAYTSPNTGKSYAVFVDYYYGYPDYLGVVDLACVLALPRTGGTHNVVGNASSCTRYVAVP